MFGTISGALVPGTAHAEGLAEFTSSPPSRPRACAMNVTSMTDRPWSALLDCCLRALNMALLSIGPTRGTLADGNARSARAGTPSMCVARSRCCGAPFGSLQHINAQVRQAVESSSELRQAILPVDHAHRSGANQAVRRCLQTHATDAASSSSQAPSRQNRGITPEDGDDHPEFSALPATHAPVASPRRLAMPSQLWTSPSAPRMLSRLASVALSPERRANLLTTAPPKHPPRPEHRLCPHRLDRLRQTPL